MTSKDAYNIDIQIAGKHEARPLEAEEVHNAPNPQPHQARLPRHTQQHISIRCS